jgi:Family of unknown function (DUF5985)
MIDRLAEAYSKHLVPITNLIHSKPNPGFKNSQTRFWKDTKDRLLLFFAMSFLLEGVNRAALGLSANPNEDEPFFIL